MYSSCTESERQFWVQDNHFLSLVENSKWLQYVSSCLSKALDAAKALYREVTVVLQGMYCDWDNYHYVIFMTILIQLQVWLIEVNKTGSLHHS